MRHYAMYQMKATRRKHSETTLPSLADEILDDILVLRIRLTRVDDPRYVAQLVQALRVLPRVNAPLTTRAVLVMQPWLHLEDLLSSRDRWLIKSWLLLSKPPHNHPLQCNWERVLETAVKLGDIAFLGWWREQQLPIGTKFDLELVCESGNVTVLDWAKSARLDIPLTETAAQRLIRNGHAAVLDWIETNHPDGPRFMRQVASNTDNVVLAVAAGHHPVVCWLRPDVASSPITYQRAKQRPDNPRFQSRLPAPPFHRRGPQDMHRALDMDILSWPCVTSAFLLSCASGNLQALDACFCWLVTKSKAAAAPTSSSVTAPTSRLFVPPNQNHRTTHLAYLYASAAGHLHVLDWLENHGFVPLTVIAADPADRGTQPATAALARIRWARLRDESALEERLLSHFVPNAREWIHVHSALDLASIMGHVPVLKWWLAMRDVMAPMDFDYTPLAVDSACRLGLSKVVAWWINSGLALKCSKSCVLAAPASLGHVNVLQVWRASTMRNFLDWDAAMLISAAQHGAVNVLEWWAKKWSVGLVRSTIQGCIRSCRDARVVEWYLDHGGSMSTWACEDKASPQQVDLRMALEFPPLVVGRYSTPSSTITPQSSHLHAKDDAEAEGKPKKDLYLAIQRLGIRYPKLPIKPLTREQVTLLAKSGCASWIKYCGARNLLPTVIDLDDLAESDNCVPTMQWIVFSQSNVRFKYSDAALVKATNMGALAVLTWWMRSSPPLAFKLSFALDEILQNNDGLDTRTAEWWACNNARLWPVEEKQQARPGSRTAKPATVERKKLRPRALSRVTVPKTTESTVVDGLSVSGASLSLETDVALPS